MQKNRDNQKLLCTVQAGLFAALTTLLTASLHIPAGNGYIHCGDAVIYLAAAVLPMPYAIGASAVGGMLADLIAGYPAYAIPTFIIKGLLALVFAKTGGHGYAVRKQIPAMVLCGLVSVVGYWMTAVILYGGLIAQIPATVPANCLQAAASGIVYAVIAAALRRVPHKE